MPETLCDAGPMIALIDAKDPHNAECRVYLNVLQYPLLTTWPVLTEAFYFLHRAGGWPYQNRLWEYLRSGVISVHTQTQSDFVRFSSLMEKYNDTPMDFADASLVAAAETLGIYKIFTLDSDFRVYRTRDGRAFEIVP